MAAALWYSSLKGKPVLQEGEGENEIEDMLFQNLAPLQPTPLPHWPSRLHPQLF